MKGLIYNALFGFANKYHSIRSLGYMAIMLTITNNTNTDYALLFWFCFSFALNTGARLQAETLTGWDRYELTLPVRKSQLIGAKFLGYAFLLLRNIAEMFILYALLSIKDLIILGRILPPSHLILSLFFGVSVALFIGTYIHPAYLMQKEKESSELLITSLLFTFIAMFIVWMVVKNNNNIIELISFPMAQACLSTSIVTFILSYFISTFYYKNRWR